MFFRWLERLQATGAQTASERTRSILCSRSAQQARSSLHSTLNLARFYHWPFVDPNLRLQTLKRILLLIRQAEAGALLKTYFEGERGGEAALWAMLGRQYGNDNIARHRPRNEFSIAPSVPSASAHPASAPPRESSQQQQQRGGGEGNDRVSSVARLVATGSKYAKQVADSAESLQAVAEQVKKHAGLDVVQGVVAFAEAAPVVGAVFHVLGLLAQVILRGD
jgi:hypothetical protein